MALRKKKSTVRTVDFTGVDSSGGGAPHIPPGEYTVKCLEAEWTESKEGNEMVAWIFQGVSGKSKGKKFYYYTPITDNSKWKFKGTLMALGQEVPDGKMEIDTDELVDLEGLAVIEDDEYQGRIRSRIAHFKGGEKVDEDEDDDDEEEVKTKSSKAANGRKKVVKYSSDEVNEMDEDQLQSLVEKNELDLDLDDHKTLRKKKTAVIASLEENELLT